MTKKYSNIILLFISIFIISSSSAFSQSEIVKTIYFESNSYSIEKKYKNSLNNIAKQISSDTFSYLKVFGYADTKGSDDYNDILSEKRANAVYNYLAARAKLDTTRVYVAWIGESEEAYDLHFPAANIQKRCVDIWIMFKRKTKIEIPK